jgi:hypothetical protein
MAASQTTLRAYSTVVQSGDDIGKKQTEKQPSKAQLRDGLLAWYHPALVVLKKHHGHLSHLQPVQLARRERVAI